MRKERREEHVSLELAKELEQMQQAENVEFNLSDFALFLSVMKNKNAFLQIHWKNFKRFYN